MITTSNSPWKGSGTPNRYAGDLLHTLGISGLSRVRTELYKLFVVPFLAPHPVRTKREGAPFEGAPKLLKMVRPERFELPTFWFVARRCESLRILS